MLADQCRQPTTNEPAATSDSPLLADSPSASAALLDTPLSPLGDHPVPPLLTLGTPDVGAVESSPYACELPLAPSVSRQPPPPSFAPLLMPPLSNVAPPPQQTLGIPLAASKSTRRGRPPRVGTFWAPVRTLNTVRPVGPLIGTAGPRPMFPSDASSPSLLASQTAGTDPIASVSSLALMMGLPPSALPVLLNSADPPLRAILVELVRLAHGAPPFDAAVLGFIRGLSNAPPPPSCTAAAVPPPPPPPAAPSALDFGDERSEFLDLFPPHLHEAVRKFLGTAAPAALDSSDELSEFLGLFPRHLHEAVHEFLGTARAFGYELASSCVDLLKVLAGFDPSEVERLISITYAANLLMEEVVPPSVALAAAKDRLLRRPRVHQSVRDRRFEAAMGLSGMAQSSPHRALLARGRRAPRVLMQAVPHPPSIVHSHHQQQF
ncbi:hypothetical protein AB1Y20_017329 [Prymnesium parvum]|uniref:Uncharacterized protein n=1 Tax=Prymnesium parvum TaxID=97485 RepID=A0AB34JNN9_PRYPA